MSDRMLSGKMRYWTGAPVRLCCSLALKQNIDGANKACRRATWGNTEGMDRSNIKMLLGITNERAIYIWVERTNEPCLGQLMQGASH
eukprot:1161222-Pelagomonas_calceolata.AAC.16